MKRIIEILENGVRDASGNPVAGGKAKFFLAGTTDLSTVFQEFDLTDPHPNPATLDGSGRLLGAYSDFRLDIVISNSSGAVVRTIRNAGTADSDITQASLAEAAGAGLVNNIDDNSKIDVNPDGTTVRVLDDKVGVVPGGINQTQLASDVTVATSLTPGTDAAKLSKGAINNSTAVTGKVQVGGNSGFPYLEGTNGKTLARIDSDNTQSRPLVVSEVPATNGLLIIRGSVNSGGIKTDGEGFTSVRDSLGRYTITFDTAYLTKPMLIVATDAAVGFSNTVAGGFAVTTALGKVGISTLVSPTDTDGNFSFIAIGETSV